LTITDIDKKGFARAEAIITNEKGIVVVESVLKGSLPGQKEKEIIRQMLSEGDPANYVFPRRRKHSYS
jgi:3-hydroxybutyryl-CoA dehydratase